jgi:hypothetical protein
MGWVLTTRRRLQATADDSGLPLGLPALFHPGTS